MSSNGITRRRWLAGAGALGTSVLLNACATTVQAPAGGAASAAPTSGANAGAASPPTPASGGGTSAATAAPRPANLSLNGWNFQPEVVRENLDRYEQMRPGSKVSFTAHATAQFSEKMLALFMSNTPLDVVYGRDDSWAAWADAGYIQPVEGMPGLDEMMKDMLPFAADGLKYRGKVWVVPYYADFMSFGYDAELLTKVGATKPPATWDELKEVALAIKKAGLLDTPVMLASGPSANLHWWTLLYGSGGSMFDANLNPVFANGQDPVALQLLEWMVQAVRDWKILDPRSIDGTTDSSRTAFAAGQVGFATAAKYDFKMMNAPSTSKIPGRAKPMMIPTFAAGKNGTCGWSRVYCIAATTADKAASWDLMRFMASPESEKNWFLKTGVGYVYKQLDSDKTILDATKEWGDADLFAKQSSVAHTRQGITEPWFSEWENFNQRQAQNALLLKVSPKDALAESARKVDELKKKYGKA